MNVGAYADELVLYSSSSDGIDQILDALAAFCRYMHMEVNLKKCLSISQTWGPKEELEQHVMPLKMKKYEHGMERYEDSPIEDISIYLGLPIGVGQEGEIGHGVWD
jgi:hypothetical protein